VKVDEVLGTRLCDKRRQRGHWQPIGSLRVLDSFAGVPLTVVVADVRVENASADTVWYLAPRAPVSHAFQFFYIPLQYSLLQTRRMGDAIGRSATDVHDCTSPLPPFLRSA
jgi:hypothetical protein